MPMMSPRLTAEARSAVGVAGGIIAPFAICAGNWVAHDLPSIQGGQYVSLGVLIVALVATMLLLIYAFICLDYINKGAALSALGASVGGAFSYGMIAMPFMHSSLATVGGLFIPLVASLPLVGIFFSAAPDRMDGKQNTVNTKM